jgi:GNAT superfamily N-acetyltransferase
MIKLPLCIKELVDLCFPLPPKNVAEIVEKQLDTYEHTILDIYKYNKIIAVAFVLRFKTGFYGVSTVCVHPKFRGKGYGKILMNKIHDQFPGIIMLYSRKYEGFYKKLGYKKIGDMLIKNNGMYLKW